jgi:hypothetical protein
MKLLKLLTNLFRRRKQNGAPHILIDISIEDNYWFLFGMLKFPDKPETWQPYYKYWELCDQQQPEISQFLTYDLGEIQCQILFEEFN